MARYAYKMFEPDVTCRGYKFPIGEWVEEEREGGANTAQNGFHCAYNPLDCLSYYHWDNKNKMFIVEVGGDCDEDYIDSKIACTRMRLVKELDLLHFVAHAMKYVAEHPKMPRSSVIYDDKFFGRSDTDFVIVCGENPKAMAPKGTVVGLLKEENGNIVAMDLYVVDGKEHKANQYYSL